MRIKIFDDMGMCTEAEVQRMIPLVSAQRREQALRYKHTLGRFCCLKSWLMLNELMEGMSELMNEWTYNEYGKPSFTSSFLHFSISHCKTGIAVAIDEAPVGIDIEAIRHADDELIARTMNETEQQQIHSDRDFTRFWTQKEAVVKAQGTGIEGFDQLQNILSECRNIDISTFEKENYIYSIANCKNYGLHCFSAKVQAADF